MFAGNMLVGFPDETEKQTPWWLSTSGLWATLAFAARKDEEEEAKEDEEDEEDEDEDDEDEEFDEEDIPRFRPELDARCVSRGETERSYPLRFVRVEPYVVPKRSLTGDGLERVDTRVLQVIYELETKPEALFVGQQVDVFVELPQK